MAKRVSDYVQNLEHDVQQRYLQKIEICGGSDPYVIDLKEWSTDIVHFPDINYIDIVNYLVFKKSAYTHEEFKAYKSLEAYKMFTCNWVRSVKVKRFEECVLAMGKVMHSQSLNKKFLQPWLISTSDGEVISAHCDCVAGLGETCSHVAALMFCIDNSMRRHEPPTVTGEKAYWVVPANVTTMLKSEDIEYTSAKKRAELKSCGAEILRTKKNATIYKELTDEDFGAFLTSLHENNTQSCILAITKPFCDVISQQREEKQNKSLVVFQEEDVHLPLEMLRAKAALLEICISQEECKLIEEETRGQADNKSWYLHRAGRITASQFKNACRTRIEKPSITTIKNVCYPYSMRFTSKATTYGCSHEREALISYKTVMNKKHQEFICEPVGFMVNPAFPVFGASLDSAVNCKCCGNGCVEVKCPYCARDLSIEEVTVIKKMCIKKTGNVMHLDRSHAYYYQIQMQLTVTERAYCDFVVWSKKDMYIERIYRDDEFWLAESRKAQDFWAAVIAPELMAKYFTNKSTVDQDIELYAENLAIENLELGAEVEVLTGAEGTFANF